MPYSGHSVAPRATDALLAGCTAHVPLQSAWVEALSTFAIGTVAQVLIATALYNLSSQPGARSLLGGCMAILYAGSPFLVLPRLDPVAPVTLFVVASLGMTGFFKTLQAACGLFPKGSDANLATYVQCFLAVPPQRWSKGKVVRAAPGEMIEAVTEFLTQFAMLGAVLSLLLSGAGVFPFGSSTHTARLSGTILHTWALYLFLAILTGFGGLVTVAGGISAEEAFNEPLSSSRSFKETWGERWNLVVHGFLKSLVYKPARAAGLPALVATVLTFVSSGLLHEYMYAIHNAGAYQPGHVCAFFVAMGCVMIVEQRISPLFPAALRDAWGALPSFVTATVLLALSAPLVDSLYMASWRESGMLPAMGDLVFTVRCE